MPANQPPSAVVANAVNFNVGLHAIWLRRFRRLTQPPNNNNSYLYSLSGPGTPLHTRNPILTTFYKAINTENIKYKFLIYNCLKCNNSGRIADTRVSVWHQSMSIAFSMSIYFIRTFHGQGLASGIAE
jgi:hypothetical protein